MLEWSWTYIAWQRSARIITGAIDLDLRQPRTDQSGPSSHPTMLQEAIAAVAHGGDREPS
jgi:hypothetical protein